MNATVSLSEDVVEHIQSFMCFKYAAQSAVLSKRLYDAWCVSKELLLDEGEFVNVNAFWYGAKRTIRRYISQRISLEKLTIRFVCGYECYFDSTRLLRAVCQLGCSEIAIHLLNDNFNYLIPSNVLQLESLRKFSLFGGALHVGHELPFLATSIEHLCLLLTAFRADFFQNIVNRCPNLKHLSCSGFLLWVDLRRLSNQTHTLESLIVHNLDFQDNVDLNLIIRFFANVKRVCLRQVQNGDNLYITSKSIEEFRIEDHHMAVTARPSLPKLKKFHFSGASWSTVTIESPPCGWTSYVSVVCFRTNGYWFSSMHRLLTSLANSKIHLKVKVVCDSSRFVCDFRVDGESIPVEFLDIGTVDPVPGIVDVMFCVCIPKVFKYNHEY